jgi:preprotein translocase subunit SecG
MSTVVTVIHVLVCIFLMLTVLLQAGKGGGMGAAFGGGSSSGTVFGGSGAGNFLRKLTVIAAAVFMMSSMTLAWMASTSGADALKRYSAQQRRAAELKEQARKDAVEETMPGDPEGTIVVPDGTDIEPQGGTDIDSPDHDTGDHDGHDHDAPDQPGAAAEGDGDEPVSSDD